MAEVDASRKKAKKDRSKEKKQKQVVNRKERKVKEMLNRAAERAAFDNVLEEYTPSDDEEAFGRSSECSHKFANSVNPKWGKDQGKFLLLHQYLLTKYHFLIIIIL